MKISLENGPIKAGDAITLSNAPGVGAKATSATQIIGYALEDYPATATSTKVLVTVQAGFWQGPMDEKTGAFSFITDALARLGATVKNGILSVLELIADRVTAKKAVIEEARVQTLCVDDVCVTRDQFLQMVQTSASGPVLREVEVPFAAPSTPLSFTGSD